MLINKLTLCDVGVFKGLVEFDLAPRQSGSRTRPVVLLGGLNGAGKTTVLNAIRLAFYGRLAVGAGVSPKVYEQHLLSLIHKDRQALVQPENASVTIEFQHAQLGVRSDYRVVRSWMRKGDGANELLQVFKGDEPIPDLSHEQIQSLLNQLVPIGIADLFFFDGEKISELATEDRPHVLSESVKRLVGLHLVERLQNDLLTYVRQARNSIGSESEVELTRAIAERDKHAESARLLETELAELDAEITRLVRELEVEETELSRMGGAWAKDRSSVKSEQNNLAARIGALEASLRDSLMSAAPLALIGKQLTSLCGELRRNTANQSGTGARKMLSGKIRALRVKLKQSLLPTEFSKAEKVVDDVFRDSFQPVQRAAIAKGMDIGEAEGRALLEMFEYSAISSEKEARQLGQDLARQRRLLNALEQQIDRAPAEVVVAQQMSRIKDLERKLIDVKAQRLQRIREIKATYWSCFDMTRAIRKLEKTVDSDVSDNRAIALSGAVHSLLGEFSLSLKAAKLRELAQALQASFQRLARKSDLISSVEFDPATFAITIRDKSGEVIPKKKLSAGEQQVFAIAVLDALLTCSGRSLPLVIDTPLGRLDSNHRERLVREYFPRAAHQVVVLSTDTEVDQRFYEDLAPHLSHSYHLQFDEETGSTKVEPGYFWRKRSEELRDAA